MDLTTLGWNPFFQQHFQPYRDQGLYPARVAREDRESYLVYSRHGELIAQVSGKMRHAATSRSEFPAVGDWVAIQPRLVEGRAIIHALLPRRSRFSRKVAGFETEEQVAAANVDTVFLISALDREFEVRRIERYLTMAWESGATPIIVLNKSDLCPLAEERVAEVELIAFGVPIYTVSAMTGQGIEALRRYTGPGQTVAMLGSSGVGKSTLINCLVGEERLKVGAVREDDSRGRHTTTHRELVPLPGGGVLIDTPGMRELQLWSDGDGLTESFEDVEDLARRCRFRDCRHDGEPGCAVQEAIAEGLLEAGRLRSYFKLQKEVRFLASRQDERLRMEDRERSKRLSRFSKERQKSDKYRDR